SGCRPCPAATRPERARHRALRGDQGPRGRRGPGGAHGAPPEGTGMIGKLTGIVDSVGEDWVILDVGGVGYMVHASGRTLGRLQTLHGPVSLLVDTRMREEQITLFGFLESAERDWFRLLTQVQGVGGRVALALLTALSPEDLA